MSSAEVAPKRVHDTEHLHDSEEYESAEEIDGEVYEDEEIEEVEVEVEEEDVEEEEEEDEDGATPVPKERELDDDEDRKNPQFIPKKGYFYEHDDRTKVDDGEEEEEEEKIEEKPKKVVVQGTAERWSHDKFEEVEQAPKSHDELSAAYGYDIRSEDQPPRARRRRRYGRGPNKYTRKWEEEEAYQKPRGGYRGNRGGGGRGGGEGGRGFRNSYNNQRSSHDGYDENFPDLGEGNEGNKSSESGDAPKNRGNAYNKRDDNSGSHNQGRTRGAWVHDRAERDDRYNNGRDRDYDSGRGGGRGRGGGGGNRGGRGRRNEFTNRNRYPDRRDSFNNNNNHMASSQSGSKQNVGYNASSSDMKEREKEKVDKSWSGHDDRRERPTTNGSSNVEKQKNDMHTSSMSHVKQQPSQRKPTLPFTNTEYTGSASLTAGNKNAGSASGSTNNLRNPSSDFENISVKVGTDTGIKDVRLVGAREQSNEYVEHDFRNSRENVRDNRDNIRDMRENIRDNRDTRENISEIRDAREIIRERQAMKEREALERQKENSRERELKDPRDNRDVNRRPSNKGYQNDRRPQIPPRLQQQAQQQQQMEQANLAAKTKRFSAQRRQVEGTIVGGGVVPPNAVVTPQQLGPGVPNMQPGVTGPPGPMITSPVPVYPPAAAYYESAPSGFDAQVYEASASPVTGNGHNHGPSVSPSLWGPHASAYTTAPYPSPPTGQVPVPQPPYADPAAFIAAAQQSGQPMYAPPQFIQDPTIINYAAAQGPPFAPPYHPQGFQGYPQVTPAPPPEMYHGGVTYYSTQNQIQRPPMITPLKRPKTVLQLVEPPEKAKESYQKQKELPVGETYPVQNAGVTEYYEIQEQQIHPTPQLTEEILNYEPEMPKTLDSVTNNLQPVAPVEFKKQRSPSPRRIEISEKDSWSAQMAELQSPTETEAPAKLPTKTPESKDIKVEHPPVTKEISNTNVSSEKESKPTPPVSVTPVASSKPVPVSQPAATSKPEPVKEEPVKVEEVKVAEVKVADKKVADVKVAEVKVAEVKSSEVKVAEAKSSEVKVAEAKSPEVKVAEVKSPEAKVAEVKSPEAKVAEVKSPEAKVAEVKSPEAKVAEAKSPEAKVTEIEKTAPAKEVIEKVQEIKTPDNSQKDNVATTGAEKEKETEKPVKPSVSAVEEVKAAEPKATEPAKEVAKSSEEEAKSECVV